jgi:hypothetical protein
MRVETISYLKQNAASLDLEEPLVITQNGQPVYRVESERLAQLRDQGIAMLKLMNLAERDVKQGNTMSLSDAKSKLREGLRQASDE